MTPDADKADATPMHAFIQYVMVRGGKDVAQATTFHDGRCVVVWPTSVIVYESERAARSVHIDHMEGRGEKTTFNVVDMHKGVERGWLEAYQDRCEGVPFKVNREGHPIAPDYVPEQSRGAWCLGYSAMLMEMRWTPVVREVLDDD